MNVATTPFRPNSSVKLTDPKKDRIMTPLFCRQLFFVSNGVELRQLGRNLGTRYKTDQVANFN